MLNVDDFTTQEELDALQKLLDITKVKEQFNKLSADSKKVILQIVSELKEGKTDTFREVYLVDYEEIPVSIDEFICNPMYLGKSTRNGESIFPYWRKKYREIFDSSLNYEEIVLTGAIGVGKTKTAVVCLAYLLYRLMCLRNPQEYFKLNEGERISIFFLNITLKLAEGVGYGTMHEYLLNSPWFMERGTVSGKKVLRYVPPKHIEISFGSTGSHALGQSVFAAMMDEVDFKKGGIKGRTALDASNAIMDAYKIIKNRIVSRFTKNNVLYGRLFLVSSKKSEHDFIEAYVDKMKNDKMLIVDEPQWVIKRSEDFDPRRFPVAVGNRSLKSMLPPIDSTEEELNALVRQGYRIIQVPLNLYHQFKLDVNSALMDLAGISVFGATSFFNFDMFSKCYIKGYKNPFSSDIITLGMSDDLRISDFFLLQNIPNEIKRMPQFIHIDGSLSGDRTGISDVGVSGLKETVQYNGANEIITNEMTYKHIFTVGIQAPSGSEISFEKTRQFIYFLKAAGFNIIGISLDGFQSADMKQMLTAQHYEAEIISLDRSPEGYLTLRSAMNDGRVGLIEIPQLETELIQLQRDVSTGKLDHPPDGSKDLSDSLAGALFNASKHKQSLIDNVQLLNAVVDVNEEVDPRQEIMDNLSRSMLASETSKKSSNKTSLSDLMSQRLDDLLNGYDDPNIIAF